MSSKNKNINLSKSLYCSGVLCPKMVWLQRNKPEEAVSSTNESVLENGNKVGKVARGYFGDYSLVEYNQDKSVMTAQTNKLMSEGVENIAEASFMTDGLYCLVDILHRDGDGYDIVEVKSSTKPHPHYTDDVSFQYYVLTKCGIKVNKAYLLYVNNKYFRHGDLEITKLFTKKDLTEEAIKRFDKVEKTIKSIRAFNDTDTEPKYPIGYYCEKPYECAFMEYCRGDVPEHSVFDIANINTRKKYKLFNQGIITFSDIIDNNIKLPDTQLLQVKDEYYKKPDSVNKAAIKSFLNKLSYPLYHLDFETYQQSVPEFDGINPYVQIPFQYSLHIEYEDGTLEHREFLAEAGTDPRRAVAESLCNDIPDNVCLLAYNMGFEKRVLKNLAEQFPDLSSHLMNMRKNLKDLAEPFQQKWYYTRGFGGRYTIKTVLPTLFPDDPELDYHNLEGVHHGGEASAAFATMASHTPEEIEVIRKNLLKYCCLDTYAMVKILQKLREVSE